MNFVRGFVQDWKEKMGTKNNPGDFDCYTNAEPDEPMFILLGRDPSACHLVRLWAELRKLEGEDPAKVTEALDCADAMERWADCLDKRPRILEAERRLAGILHEMSKG